MSNLTCLLITSEVLIVKLNTVPQGTGKDTIKRRFSLFYLPFSHSYLRSLQVNQFIVFSQFWTTVVYFSVLLLHAQWTASGSSFMKPNFILSLTCTHIGLNSCAVSCLWNVMYVAVHCPARTEPSGIPLLHISLVAACTSSIPDAHKRSQCSQTPNLLWILFNLKLTWTVWLLQCELCTASMDHVLPEKPLVGANWELVWSSEVFSYCLHALSLNANGTPFVKKRNAGGVTQA